MRDQDGLLLHSIASADFCKHHPYVTQYYITARRSLSKSQASAASEVCGGAFQRLPNWVTLTRPPSNLVTSRVELSDTAEGILAVHSSGLVMSRKKIKRIVSITPSRGVCLFMRINLFHVHLVKAHHKHLQDLQGKEYSYRFNFIVLKFISLNPT